MAVYGRQNELSKGLELVTAACTLDHLAQYKDALPKYVEALVFLRKAKDSNQSDSRFIKMGR